MVAAGFIPDRLTPEDARAIYVRCKRLLDERKALPWWNWWRFSAINREVQRLLATLEDAS